MWKSLFRRQLLELLGFLQQALGMNASGPAGSQGKIQRSGQFRWSRDETVASAAM
jgi:hypothetical protein